MKVNTQKEIVIAINKCHTLLLSGNFTTDETSFKTGIHIKKERTCRSNVRLGGRAGTVLFFLILLNIYQTSEVYVLAVVSFYPFVLHAKDHAAPQEI